MRGGKRCRRDPRRQALTAVLGLGVLLALAVTAALALPRLRTEEAPPDPEAVLAQKALRPAPLPPLPEPDPAEVLLGTMTAREKLCQLFIMMPGDLTGEKAPTESGEALREALEAWPVGGLIYDKSNLVSQEQTRAMLAGAQGFSKVPLLLTCDEEGGRVNRLMGKIGTTWVGAMLKYKDQGPEKAWENARTIAGDLSSCGFNLDLAPVADVWSNPANKAIGDRAYSDDFHQAAELVAAAVEGFHVGGTACTLKHFPGHGSTTADTHYGAVRVDRTLDQLRREEFLPFQAGIEAGADGVMMGHLTVPDVEDCPALFSRRLVTDILRGELGFEGVVLSDSLQMQAMTDHYTSGEIALSALQAGVDVLLCPLDLEDALQTLTEAVEAGTLSQERVDESVLRILRLKEARGLLEGLPEAVPEPPEPRSWGRRFPGPGEGASLAPVPGP